MEIKKPQLEILIKRAKEAAENAYCPYSRFPVGAAVLTEEGEIFSGCNVENASFGLTICAERVAIFNAVQQGKTKITAVVIYTPTETPQTSCGSCRQVISEFSDNASVISICNGPDQLEYTAQELLPGGFKLQKK